MNFPQPYGRGIKLGSIKWGWGKFLRPCIQALWQFAEGPGSVDYYAPTASGLVMTRGGEGDFSHTTVFVTITFFITCTKNTPLLYIMLETNAEAN